MRTEALRDALVEAAGPPPAAAPVYRQIRRHGRRLRRRRMVWVAALIGVVVVPAGIFWSVRDQGHAGPQRIATGPGTTTSSTPVTHRPVARPPAQVQAALAAWKDFPITVTPRPVIVKDLVNAPARGFPTDDTKNAYESGQLNMAVALPNRPARADSYPLIIGQVTLDRLRSGGSPGPVAASHLTITSVTLRSGLFQTDRGVKTLPAWEFTFAGIADPAQVLAIAPPDLFTPPPVTGGPSLTADAAVTLVGDRTLIVKFGGDSPQPGPCGADYALNTYSSDHAVAVVVHKIPRPIPSGGYLCAGVGHLRQLRTILDRPLGRRVVIDGTTRAAILSVAP